MARTGMGARMTHVVLSLHASPCQLQRSGLRKGKREDGCTDQLNCRNPPHGSEANSSIPRFPLPFPTLTQCWLLFLTSALGGRLEHAGEKTEGKGRIACAKNICTLTWGHPQTHRCRISAALAHVLLAWGLLMVGPTDGAKHLPLCSGVTGWGTFLSPLILVQVAAVKAGAGLWLISVANLWGQLEPVTTSPLSWHLKRRAILFPTQSIGSKRARWDLPAQHVSMG